ncbi:MAG: hypothetical protein ACFFDF_25185 [Candidatus Odinarchaeota archaeon]
MPKDFKKNVRKSILIELKKRNIIDTVSSGKCPICEEFLVKNHLPVFQGHHENEQNKKHDVSYLFKTGLSCSAIVKILKAEHIGFICGNCHKVIQNIRDPSILNQIYDKKKGVNKILNDYNRVLSKFKPINDESSLINNPLKKKSLINDNVIRYLFAIDEIFKNCEEVNTNTLSNYLGVSTQAVRYFSNIQYEIIYPFVNIIQERPKILKKFSLTDYGKEAIALLDHFKDYYIRLR